MFLKIRGGQLKFYSLSLVEKFQIKVKLKFFEALCITANVFGKFSLVGRDKNIII